MRHWLKDAVMFVVSVVVVFGPVVAFAVLVAWLQTSGTR